MFITANKHVISYYKHMTAAFECGQIGCHVVASAYSMRAKEHMKRAEALCRADTLTGTAPHTIVGG